MPSCFSLTRKGEKETAILHYVDAEMRKHFKVADDGTWYQDWYNTIGLALACGNDWEKIRGYFPQKKDIIDWLEENYTTDSWREWK